ncbi:30S ribosomal protein S13 [Candidatus Marsarchaeota archaeon]|nr:30S ribosomal protein S13 [Candidatus Marsarchaeota archaeon]MCL5404562.1 30S ribosomal protein S13 [Candidatus Marsarchaeota archaeon]
MAEEKGAQGAEKQHGRKETAAKATSIIRIAGKDVNGELSLRRAIDEVKGIGSSMANALSFAADKKLGLSPDTKIGSLAEDKISALEELIKNPAKFGIPTYMLNHRKNFETGLDAHFVGNDLIFANRQDIAREVTLRTWRGMRHQYGQKVRGQHTRSTGRTGATVGVTKKSVAKPGAPAGKEEKKK